jgi:hypothetical protein
VDAARKHTEVLVNSALTDQSAGAERSQLSDLNGTKPGKIDWNKDFIIPIIVYGIVPNLALLGAQFPQSVGQIVSHLIPSEAMHH